MIDYAPTSSKSPATVWTLRVLRLPRSGADLRYHAEHGNETNEKIPPRPSPLSATFAMNPPWPRIVAELPCAVCYIAPSTQLRTPRPRTVSVVAGVVYAVVGESLLFVYIANTVFLIPAMMMGAFLGYVAGVCIAAAPLISDLIRSAVRRGSPREDSSESD